MEQYVVSYNGLRKKDTYNGIINYLQTKQEKIKYPNRVATLLRASPYLTNLDGPCMAEMDQKQEN